MKKKLFILGLLLGNVAIVRSQDSVRILFRNTMAKISSNNEFIRIKQEDKHYYDTIFNTRHNKFLYMRVSVTDSLPVEFGVLGLYKITNKLYLLREGIWILENSEQKVLFQNSGDDDRIIDETPVDTSPKWMDGSKGKKRKKKQYKFSVVTNVEPKLNVYHPFGNF